jgi:hypothetical protein
MTKITLIRIWTGFALLVAWYAIGSAPAQVCSQESSSIRGCAPPMSTDYGGAEVGRVTNNVGSMPTSVFNNPPMSTGQPTSMPTRPESTEVPNRGLEATPRGLDFGSAPSKAQCAKLLARSVDVPSLRTLPDYRYCSSQADR